MAEVSQRQLSERQRVSGYEGTNREHPERIGNQAKHRAALAPTDGVITPLAQATIDEIFINGIAIMSRAKAVDQSAGHARGTPASRPNRRGGPRSSDNRSARRAGSCACGRAGTASHRRPFQRLPGAPTRSHVIFRPAHAQVDIALSGRRPPLDSSARSDRAPDVANRSQPTPPSPRHIQSQSASS